MTPGAFEAILDSVSAEAEVKSKREASLQTAESMAPAHDARGCRHASVRTHGMRGRTWLSALACSLVAAMAIFGATGVLSATVPRTHTLSLQRSSTTSSRAAQRQGIAGIAGNCVLHGVTRHDLAPVPRAQKKVLPACVWGGLGGEGVLPLRLRGGVRMLDVAGGERWGGGRGGGEGKSRAAGGGGIGRGGDTGEGEAEGAAKKKTVRGKDGFKVCVCVSE